MKNGSNSQFRLFTFLSSLLGSVFTGLSVLTLAHDFFYIESYFMAWVSAWGFLTSKFWDLILFFIPFGIPQFAKAYLTIGLINAVGLYRIAHDNEMRKPRSGRAFLWRVKHNQFYAEEAKRNKYGHLHTNWTAFLTIVLIDGRYGKDLKSWIKAYNYSTLEEIVNGFIIWPYAWFCNIYFHLWESKGKWMKERSFWVEGWTITSGFLIAIAVIFTSNFLR